MPAIFLLLFAALPLAAPGFAQENWTVPLRVSNAAGESVLLTLGQAAEATPGVDADLGERELPPLPPLTLIDIRFQIEGTNGAATDLRPPEENRQTWSLQIQAGSGGYPIALAWSPATFPPGATVELLDALTGGDLIRVDMLVESSHTIDNPGFTNLLVQFEAPTAVFETTQSPQGHALDPNYPNPFNGATQIPFRLGQAAEVSLAIYSLAGQFVRTLWDGQLPAGAHSYAWDGNAHSGRPVASGPYFYVLKTPDGSLKRTLVLLR